MFKKKKNKEKIEFEIVTKDEAFWRDKRDLSEKSIKALKEDYEIIPRLIKFHEEIIKLCEGNIKNATTQSKT